MNVLWSYLFFHRQRPDLALFETAPFLTSILVMMFVGGRLDARAGWLIAPYLVWVVFATVLNAAIVRLNAASRRIRG